MKDILKSVGKHSLFALWTLVKFVSVVAAVLVPLIGLVWLGAFYIPDMVLQNEVPLIFQIALQVVLFVFGLSVFYGVATTYIEKYEENYAKRFDDDNTESEDR